MSLSIRLPRRAWARPLVVAVALAGPAFLFSTPRPARADEADPPAKDDEAEAREILNPYHPRPVWRLWTRDPGPVTFTINEEQKTFAPPAEADRRVPQLPAGPLPPAPPVLVPVAEGPPGIAGFWDDAFMSLDGGHSGLRAPNRQFIIAPNVRSGMSLDEVRLRLALGVNFTSQSYAARGRHIVDDQDHLLNDERLFFFANCVRASPAHASFTDNDPDAIHDDYDGLFGHSYQSVGQSSSEIRGLEKMILAGGCLSREVKDLVKLHGTYPALLLALFKAALPYADAAGTPLPYEHELRHRPAYSSHGDVGHAHYCAANVHYHGYDEFRHLAAMMDLARRLDAAPPVAILRIRSLTVKKDGATLRDAVTADARVKAATLTQARVWGNEGETLELVIDLAASYDLQGRPLEFTCRPLYANQQNLTVEDLGGGAYRLVARHDPALPKGRLPVIATARNGGPLPSSPVFVNFYWNEPDENPDFDDVTVNRLSPELREKYEALLAKRGAKRYPVTRNRRPQVRFDITGDAVRCRPGETVRVPFTAVDPEGFPVTVTRREGEPGELGDGAVAFTAPADAPPAVERVHLVFSDGTGGFTGSRLQFLVSPEPDELAEGWRVSVLGRAATAARATIDAEGRWSLGPTERRDDKRPIGTFLHRVMEGDGDWLLELPEGGAGAALTIRRGLEDHWRFVAATAGPGVPSGLYQPIDAVWNTVSVPAALAADEPTRFLRVSRRAKQAAAYRSADGVRWEQMGGRRMEFPGALVGVVQTGGAAVGGWLRPAAAELPLIDVEGSQRGKRTAPAEVKIEPPVAAGVVLRYTLDGSDPGPDSPPVEAAIRLAEPGRHELRVGVFAEGQSAPSAVVATVMTVDPPAAGK